MLVITIFSDVFPVAENWRMASHDSVIYFNTNTTPLGYAITVDVKNLQCHLDRQANRNSKSLSSHMYAIQVCSLMRYDR